MTSIAYRDGVIAADTLCVNGHIRSGFTRKIARGPNGELAGACGGAGYCRAFLEWVEKGRAGDPPKAMEDDGSRDLGFVVLPDGTIEQHEPEGVNVMSASLYAAGSGRQIIQGAMTAGAEPRRAVEIAIELDCYSGGDIMVLTSED